MRGMSPWPGAFTTARGRPVKILATHVVGAASRESKGDTTAGQIVLADKSRLIVACGDGLLELVTVQPEGKRAMRASDWVMGRGVAEGDRLGS